MLQREILQKVQQKEHAKQEENERFKELIADQQKQFQAFILTQNERMKAMLKEDLVHEITTVCMTVKLLILSRNFTGKWS
jgi:hypothetical protein